MDPGRAPDLMHDPDPEDDYEAELLARLAALDTREPAQVARDSWYLTLPGPDDPLPF